MVCRVAEMLVHRGQASSAANIMQRQAKLFLSDGWLLLSRHVLKDLLDCHLQMYQVSSRPVFDCSDGPICQLFLLKMPSATRLYLNFKGHHNAYACLANALVIHHLSHASALDISHGLQIDTQNGGGHLVHHSCVNEHLQYLSFNFIGKVEMGPVQVANVAVCMQLLSLSVACKSLNKTSSMVQEAMVSAAETSGGKSFSTSTIGASEPANASLAALDVLQVEPVGGKYSRFFGQSEVSFSCLLQWPGNVTIFSFGMCNISDASPVQAFAPRTSSADVRSESFSEPRKAIILMTCHLDLQPIWLCIRTQRLFN